MRLLVWCGVATTLVGLGLGAGCTKDTPGFCCSSVASCAGTGADGVVMCDPGSTRPFCDDTGTAGPGPAHTCIPDPSAPACTSSLECLESSRPVCDVDDTATCIGCASANDCTRFGERGLCDPDSRACVQCVVALDCAAPTEPICGDDGLCRGCTGDSECTSGICDEGSGACALETDIIYVDAATGAGTACTRTAPCLRVTEGVAAITATRRYMLVAAGNYQESVVIDGKTVTILGAGASLQAAGLNQAALVVLNASTVRLEGLRLHDNGGGTSADGVRCAAPTAGTPSLTMVDVRIEGNVGYGVDANGCGVTIDDSTIANNPGGGVSIVGGTFTITNTYITENGGAATSVGGVKLDNNDAASVFEFNTVARNIAAGGLSPALICSSVQPQRIANNILWGAGAEQVTVMNCDLEFNLSNEGLSGSGNVNGNPTFVSGTDYHLMATSDGVDDADPDATLGVDADGDLRPQGGRRDIGADEVRP